VKPLFLLLVLAAVAVAAGAASFISFTVELLF
jgi:hypothetical protein